VKRIRGDKLNGVVIHICMEISQKNFLYIYLYLKLAKIFFFFFHKIVEQEGGTGPTWGTVGVGRVGTSGRGEVAGKGGRKMTTVYTCM
jgi:hypothetical protein